MRGVSRLVVVAGTVLLLSAASSAVVALPRTEGGHGGATPTPSASTLDHDAGHHEVAPAPSAPDHGTGTSGHDGHSTGTPEPSGGHDGHSTGTPEPSGGTGTSGHDGHSTGTPEPSGGHDEHGTTVASTGPDADTRLLVLSLFAGLNALVLMVAIVQRSRTAGARDRRRTARAAAPPAV